MNGPATYFQPTPRPAQPPPKSWRFFQAFNVATARQAAADKRISYSDALAVAYRGPRVVLGLTGITASGSIPSPLPARRRGQVALIGSVAGLRGLPYSPGYCASKAGVR